MNTLLRLGDKTKEPSPPRKAVPCTLPRLLAHQRWCEPSAVLDKEQPLCISAYSALSLDTVFREQAFPLLLLARSFLGPAPMCRGPRRPELPLKGGGGGGVWLTLGFGIREPWRLPSWAPTLNPR